MSQSPQSKGGRARAKKLTTEQRREIALQAAEARWARIKDPNRISEASHQGILMIGDVDLDVYVLEDQRRVLHKKAIANALGLKSQGGNAFMRSVTRKGVRSVIPQNLFDKIDNPIAFNLLGGESADGYEASTFIEICDIFIEARNTGVLHPKQQFLAIQAEIIVRSAAKVGIVALIDEATGYIEDKRKEEYRKLFEAFITKECREWRKEFPDKFFDMIYRLYGLKRQNPDPNRHPSFFGNFIRKYIYFPLANSNGAVLEQLDEKNPVVYAKGRRQYKLHQYLSEEVGVPVFKEHLWQVMGIGLAALDKKRFDRAFYRAFPEAAPHGSAFNQLDLFPELLEDA